MKFPFLIALPFLAISCANLAPDKEEEEVTEPPKPRQEAQTIDAPEPRPNEDLEFADPDTTNRLLGEENKKTVDGPAPVNVPAPDADSAINVKPSIPAPSAE